MVDNFGWQSCFDTIDTKKQFLIFLKINGCDGAKRLIVNQCCQQKLYI